MTAERLMLIGGVSAFLLTVDWVRSRRLAGALRHRLAGRRHASAVVRRLPRRHHAACRS